MLVKFTDIAMSLPPLSIPYPSHLSSQNLPSDLGTIPLTAYAWEVEGVAEKKKIIN
jgi:hypothetical protein